MPDQMQSLVATAEAMIASQGVPRTPENIQRAVQMLAANPESPRTQVARRTGISRAPDALYLGDDVGSTSVDAAGASAPSQQMLPPSAAAPEAALNTAEMSAGDDDIQETDQFTAVQPSGGGGGSWLPPVVGPAVVGAAGGGVAAKVLASQGGRPSPQDMAAIEGDVMGMDIEGQGRNYLPTPEDRLRLAAPQGGQPAQMQDVLGGIPERAMLEAQASVPIAMPNEGSGPTISPTAEWDYVRNERTGKEFRINRQTGEAFNVETGKPLNSSAAQAMLRVVRRM